MNSCGNDDDDLGGGDTYCWEFRVTQVTSVVGTSVPGYPQTVTSTTSQCGLTEAQANEVVKGLTTESTSSASGITVKIKTTATKTKK
ncbi:hypothetical protein JGH11_11045 [Dysgonomonas sp. Marseille-P4677]|uniref:hypothetical protein n=1 Tax=Dysgonomonas sp. Marseille-P4677 TaxID=2364790 RepID=UPI00191324A9|nr:hypothetical protein [Dysgonomonas sp. Marseille-P4677]MBK5721410.1 hypothetical protein [Dysgonomonas sp. Marseille-P4677]